MAMKRLLQSTLFKRNYLPEKGHVLLCQKHDTLKYKNVRALGISHIFLTIIEYCITCDQSCCYLCGNQHIEGHCAHDCIFCN